MKASAGFTRRDVIVIVGCVVFALLNLQALSAGGRGRAKQAVCSANLRRWGDGFEMYTNDHNNCLMEGWVGHGFSTKAGWVWDWALEPYVGKMNKLLLCPEAIEPMSPYGNGKYPNHAAWYIQDGSKGGINMTGWGFRVGDCGSYGVNRYIYNTPPDSAGRPRTSLWHNPDVQGRNWKVANVAGAANVPVLAGATWVGGNPDQTDSPLGLGQGDMKTFIIDRHDGGINMLFMDWSVRHVRLKCLWTLKWHRQWNTCNVWTPCGGVEKDDWPDVDWPVSWWSMPECVDFF